MTEQPSGSGAGRVFPRVFGRRLPVAVRAKGATIWDADGRAYLDGAGGAVVVGIGHGRAEIAATMAAQAERVAYAHGTAFTTDALEAYAAEIGALLPLDAPAIYPVSGGSEAVETALKMARSYHLARGEQGRDVVIARWGSYHGNSLGALDLSGREPAAPPVRPVAGAVPARLDAVPLPGRAGGRPCARRSGGPRRRAGRRDRRRRPGSRGRVRRRADRGRHARRGRAARRLLAGDRRRLPAPRRAPRRRRGDDRVRAHRPLVRQRPLGPASGHPGRRQGRDLRVLAVRVRRGVRRRCTRRSRPAGSSTGSRSATPRSAPRSPARSCGSCATRTW